MTTRSNPTNATEMKIRENEIIQRRGKQIMKRLPFEINQIILMYLEDGRGINIKALQSWRIFMASSAIRPNNNFEGFSGINEMMYNPFNEALNRCYRKTEVAYRCGDMSNEVRYMNRSASTKPYEEESPKDYFIDVVVNKVERETQIRDMIMSSDFFPHIGRYEYIRLILEVCGYVGEATILIAETPTHHNNTGVYELRRVMEDNAIAEYGTTVGQIYNCYDCYRFPDDDAEILYRYRWIAEFRPEILYVIFLRFPQDVRKEMLNHYSRDCQHFPRMTDREHGQFCDKLFSSGRETLRVDEISYLQGSDLGRCLLLSMILLDIDANGRKTYIWNMAIFEKFGVSYGARGNFKIFLIELSRIWGVEKMLKEAYRWRKRIDEAIGLLDTNTARACAYDGEMYKFERVFRLEDLDNEENYEDLNDDGDGDGIIHDVNPEEIDGDALDGDGGNY